ncbi:MAG: ATP-binding cassette domain-containing protein, partial [Tomitella sp.]|nr:ATP-binding cassette domain-containing protein [Tomitella sp.]
MTAPVLEISGVEFRRGGQQILADIDLTVRAGEHWALLGPNGAGKTTLMRLCGALEHPTSGTVHVLGNQVGRVELQRLRQNIGHVDPRHPLRSPLTIRQVVLTGLRGSIDLP